MFPSSIFSLIRLIGSRWGESKRLESKGKESNCRLQRVVRECLSALFLLAHPALFYIPSFLHRARAERR